MGAGDRPRVGRVPRPQTDGDRRGVPSRRSGDRLGRMGQSGQGLGRARESPHHPPRAFRLDSPGWPSAPTAVTSARNPTRGASPRCWGPARSATTPRGCGMRRPARTSRTATGLAAFVPGGLIDGSIATSHDRRPVRRGQLHGGRPRQGCDDGPSSLFTLVGHTETIFMTSRSAPTTGGSPHPATTGRSSSGMRRPARGPDPARALLGRDLRDVQPRRQPSALRELDTTAILWDATPSGDALSEARWLVERLSARWPLRSELIERLRGDLTLPGPVRAAALTLAAQSTENPRLLANASWEVVRPRAGGARTTFVRCAGPRPRCSSPPSGSWPGTPWGSALSGRPL